MICPICGDNGIPSAYLDSCTSCANVISGFSVGFTEKSLKAVSLLEKEKLEKLKKMAMIGR